MGLKKGACKVCLLTKPHQSHLSQLAKGKKLTAFIKNE